MRNHVLLSMIVGLTLGSATAASAQGENSPQDSPDRADQAQPAPAPLPAAQQAGGEDPAEPAREPVDPAAEPADTGAGQQAEAQPDEKSDKKSDKKSDEKPDEKSDEKSDKKSDKAEEDRELELKGRVFARNTVVRDGWANQLAVASARLGAVYRDRFYGLRVEVDIELAEGDAEVRDAHVRWRANRHLRVQVGRFKRPISAISLESRWDLPVIERGYLNDLQFAPAFSQVPDELPLSGRAAGVAVTLRDRKLPASPELVIGVFRSAVPEQLGGVGASLRWTEQFPEDVFARLEVEPAPWLKLASSVAWVGQLDTAGDRATFRHGYVASLDAVVERGRFRGWIEGFVGASPLHLRSGQDAVGRFMAARAIASGRWPVSELLYLEPYATIQFLDSSDELEDDRIVQGGGGVNLGIGEAWRIQTGVDHASVGSLLLVDGGTLFLAQLGAVF